MRANAARVFVSTTRWIRYGTNAGHRGELGDAGIDPVTGRDFKPHAVLLSSLRKLSQGREAEKASLLPRSSLQDAI